MSLEARLGLSLGRLSLDVELSVARGQVVVLLGPNGAGKTTCLRALAGLLPLGSGRVVLDGEVMEDVVAGVRVPPERRPVGMVFQDYLLFPHLSALENVAFGLRSRGTHTARARREAHEWLERMGLAERAAARPGELSGGEAQRVALARALATNPRLLLLDEPLSALDAGVRADLRRDLRRRLSGFSGTSLLVTHDPMEAVALADWLLVMEGGRLVQAGSIDDLARRPRSRYVASLVGVNLWRGVASGGEVLLQDGSKLAFADSAEGEVFAVVHPRSVALHRQRPEGTPRNVWSGRADSLDLEGDRVRVRVEGSPPVVAEVTPAAVAELGLRDGGEVWVSVKATEVTVYPT